MKKIKFIFLAMFMIISLSATPVFAVDETFEQDDLTYKIVGEDSVSVMAADLTRSVYNIPAKITYNDKEYTVVSLDKKLFYKTGEVSALTTVTLPNTLKSIGALAFRDCKNLTTIEIPDGITVIEESTFDGCTNLKSIKFPNQLAFIKGDAFRDCVDLESINIPDSTQEIRENAFLNCDSLVSVVIPKNVKYLGGSSFLYCDLLEEVTLSNHIQTVGSSTFESSPLLSRILVMTDTKDEVIHSQILVAMNKMDNYPQLFRGVTHINMSKDSITMNPNSKINLNSYFSKLFDVYDESGNLSSVMEIPQSYQNIEYQLIGQHSQQTQIVGNQLAIGSDEKETLQVEANLNGNCKILTIHIKRIEILNVEIVSMPNQLTYIEGEVFNPTGLKIKVTYSNGSHEVITYNEESKNIFHFSIDRPLKVSDKKVQVEFMDQLGELNITVLNKPIINENNGNHDNNLLLKEENQSNLKPITADYTNIAGIGVLMIFSGVMIFMNMKKRKDTD